MKFLRVCLAVCFYLLGATAVRAEQQWVEVTSPHFSVITDGGEKRAREVGLRFEQMRIAFGVIFQKLNVNTAPLEIVAFRNGKEMKQHAPLFQGKSIEVAGLFLGDGGHGRRTNTEDRQYILLDLSAEDNWGTVFHEYAHLLINSNVAATPLWFDEGFAEYCSSLKVNKKEIDLGLARPDLVETLSSSGWLKLADLFSVGHDSKIYNRDDRRSLLYAQSWITVHYFMSKAMMKQVAAYVHLNQDEHEPVADAVRHAFGVEPQQLEKEINGYFRSGRVTYFKAPAPPGSDEFAFSAHPLNDLDLRTVLADLDFQTRDYRGRGISALQQITGQEPNNVTANRDLGYAALQKGDWETAESYFKRAASGSKDPQVHYLVAFGLNRKSMSTGHPPEDLAVMKQELTTAIALDPNYADAYGLLGLTLAYSGEKDSAIETLKKAIQLNPRNEWNYINLANVYLRAQDFDSALPLLQRLQSSSDPQIAMMAGRQMESLQNYKESLARWKEETAARHEALPVKSKDEDADNASDTDEAPKQAVTEKPQPVLFMKGVLNSVDCSSSPAAVLTITSGGKKWKMLAADGKKLIVIGADSLSCAWSNRKVAVNYRKTGDNEGHLVSLELE